MPARTRGAALQRQIQRSHKENEAASAKPAAKAMIHNRKKTSPLTTIMAEDAREREKRFEEILCSSSDDSDSDVELSTTKKKTTATTTKTASQMLASPLRIISRDSPSSNDTSFFSSSSSPGSSGTNKNKRPSPLAERIHNPTVFPLDDSFASSSSVSASKRVKIQQPPKDNSSFVDLNSSLESSLNDSLDDSLNNSALTDSSIEFLGSQASQQENKVPTSFTETKKKPAPVKSAPVLSFQTPSKPDVNPPKNNPASARRGPAPKPTPNKYLPQRRGGRMAMLSKERQRTECMKIRNRADRALQKLLFNANFQFTLLPHQFIAVRRIAGMPATFPLHEGSEVEKWRNARIEQAIKGLDLPENQCTTKGFCLCDGMGLGKTVQAVAGMILANQIAAALDQPKLPCIIVSPNDAVQDQWIETLDKNGVSVEKKVVHFVKGRTMERDMQGDKFVLMTRHALQGEIKDLFYNGAVGPKRTNSPLFPYADEYTLTELSDEYNFQAGKSQRTQRERGETRDDTVTRIMKSMQQYITKSSKKLTFRMSIVDEAHFLKNRVTYWTMAAALVGAHAHRSIPLTGTPYNNNLGDFATMATLIDASEENASTSWWEDTVDKNDTSTLIQSHESKPYLKDFILRRGKEEIQHHLPVKHVVTGYVPVCPAELSIYTKYEAKLAELLTKFRNCMNQDGGWAQQQKLKNIFQIMMAHMSSMRSSLIHPLLPARGREVTQLFSPTRKEMNRECCQVACVCCKKNIVPSQGDSRLSTDPINSSIPSNTTRTQTNGAHIDEMQEGEDYNDDVNMDEEAADEEDEELVAIPEGPCRFGEIHFVHERCLKQVTDMYEATGRYSCPRCKDLYDRTRSPLPEEEFPDEKYWCKDVVEEYPDGFVGTPKINCLVEWIQHVPKSEKCIIVSFFKGSLDLVEGILWHDLQTPSARFDGDLSPQEKTAELKRFRTDPACRILLMTVQSGGVGLNITEANHMAFLDRWFNPFVHLQCEDRIHRLGQQRDCTITYFDTCHTIDESMCVLNSMKQQNSDFLLGDDGPDKVSQDAITQKDSGSLKYQDLNGVVRELVTTIQRQRLSCSEAGRQYEPMLPAHGNLISVIENFTSKSSPSKTNKVKDDPENDIITRAVSS